MELEHCPMSSLFIVRMLRYGEFKKEGGRGQENSSISTSNRDLSKFEQPLRRRL
jgi:hypothetical protein